MKSKLKIWLVAGVAAFCLCGNTAPAASAKNSSKSAAKSAGTNGKTTALASQFVPSKYAGVMVRSVPQANPHAKRGTSIYRKPGAARPTRALRPGTRGVVTKSAGKSAKGGMAAKLPNERMPMITAHRDKSGKLVIK